MYSDEINGLERKLKEYEIEKEIDSAIRLNIDNFGYENLDKTEKSEIHEKLNNIRTIVENSELDDRKKNALFSKISDLAAEVDRKGTKTDAFFGLMADVGIHLGSFAKNAKPMTDEVKDIVKIISRARARTEDVALPANSELLLIEETTDEHDHNG